MFNSHLFKVILGFCGMIILGLGLLVVIDSFRTKEKQETTTANTVDFNSKISTPSVTTPATKSHTTPKK